MKLVKLKCPNCGANLNLEADKDIIKCKFCGMNAIVDDEKIVVEHKIKDDKYETALENAFVYLNKLKKYKKSKELFLILSEIKPSDPQVWKGLIKSETKNFNELSLDSNGKTIVDLKLVKSAFEDWQSLSEEDKEFKDEYDNYCRLIYKIKTEHSKKKQKKNKALLLIFICFLISLLVVCSVVYYIS